MVVVQKAQLLARVKTGLIFRPARTLADGSYVARVDEPPRHRSGIAGIEVRMLERTLRYPGRTGDGRKHRLLTSLMDEHLDPATDLVARYHERGEEERTIDELKTHQRERRCCGAKPRRCGARRLGTDPRVPTRSTARRFGRVARARRNSWPRCSPV
ncbi:hypothetical protein [Frigoriglobus tundricola]|uniref:Mobile element protein n=1 Tax=Frigoriglobus tundricola TaxID=2774151 RepID=A0A6M5Z4X3_9BACT|nr:hypothetical protein [Frigoriglobus tundricola]QJX00514.1 hypothetical protein FTUN_8144 [Frigoriglobus tundricola]